MAFVSNLLAPTRLFNAKLSHFSHFHEIQEIYVFVVFFSTKFSKSLCSRGLRILI